jgi:hypothetical protein
MIDALDHSFLFLQNSNYSVPERVLEILNEIQGFDNLLSTTVKPMHQAAKGSLTRIVSSRSGLVDSNATGTPINSSIRRT